MGETFLVCDRCLTAACWHGEIMCGEAVGAGLYRATRRQLERLAREHPSYWDSPVSEGATKTPFLPNRLVTAAPDHG